MHNADNSQPKLRRIAGANPPYSSDPGDRLIIATTTQLNAQLLSLDSSFPAYSELAGKLVKM
ncbi:MAG: hypothetical protein WAW41_08905 [Methylobacter sp.]